MSPVPASLLWPNGADSLSKKTVLHFAIFLFLAFSLGLFALMSVSRVAGLRRGYLACRILAECAQRLPKGFPSKGTPKNSLERKLKASDRRAPGPRSVGSPG